MLDLQSVRFLVKVEQLPYETKLVVEKFSDFHDSDSKPFQKRNFCWYGNIFTVDLNLGSRQKVETSNWKKEKSKSAADQDQNVTSKCMFGWEV